MTLSVTITAPNTVNEYGLTLVNGSTYSLADDLARSLVAQGKASWSASQSLVEAASPTSVSYKSGVVDLAQMGASKGASSKQIANAFTAGIARGGHLRLSDPGTYVLDAFTASIVAQSNCTIEICANVILDTTSMSVPCITATSKSNIRICGDGKIVCSASSVPTFTSVTGLEVSVRIEDASGNALAPSVSGGGSYLRVRSGTSSVTTLVLPSRVVMTCAPGGALYRTSGTNAPLIKNKHCGYINKENRFTRASNVATVLDAGHTLAVGDQVYVLNLTDTTFNGLQTVASVVAGVSWTYANAGANYSSGSGTKYGYIIPVRRTIPLASFTANTDFPTQAATGYTYVADANTDVRVGFLIWIAGPGVVEVVRVDATGFTYAGAVPTDSTVALSYDYDITIDGGKFDGNRSGQTTTNGGMEVCTMQFGCANNVRIRNAMVGGTALRAINMFGCQGVELDNVEVYDSLVGAQFEGGGKRLRCYNIKGSSAIRTTTSQQTDDFLAFTGTIYDAGSSYNNTVSPYGPCSFDDLRIRDCYASSALNGIKIAADDTMTFDNISVDGLVGGVADPVTSLNPGAAISIIDDGTGITGTTVGRLTVRNTEWTTPSGAGGLLVNFDSSGSVRELDIDNADADNNSSNPGLRVRGTGTVTRLRLSGFNFGTPVAPVAGANVVIMTGTAAIKELTLENFEASFGTSAGSNTLITTAAGNTITRCTIRNGQLHPDAAGRGVLGTFVGRIDDIILDNVHATDANGLSNVFQFLKTGGGLTTNVYVNNCRILAASHFTDTGVDIGTTQINHHVNNSRLSLSGGNNIFQYSSAGATVVRVFSSGSVYSNRARLFLQSAGAVTYSFEEGGIVMRQGTITTGQLLALNATPITIVPAPGASLAEVLVGMELFYDYNSAAYAGIALTEDLAVRYTGSAGAIVAECEATGFLDQTSDQVRYVYPIPAAAVAPIGDVTPVANAPLVLHMLVGEITTGNSPLLYRVFTRQINTSWP